MVKQRRGGAIAWLALLVMFFLSKAPTRAEGYGDQSLYDLTKVPDRVLVDAIGFAVIAAEVYGEKPASGPAIAVAGFPTFGRAAAGFVPARKFLFSETLPIGRIGWGASYRYLLTGRDGDYLQVVIDPYADRRAWIRLNQKNGDRAVIFADLAGRTKPVTEEIGIFFLSPKTRLYSDPRPDAKSIVLHQCQEADLVCYPAVFKEDFVQIGVRRPTDSGMVDEKPRGWIRARDDRGRLAFHLYMVAWD